MATIDIKLLKKHVRADDFAGDDDYLQHLLNAAEAQICKATNREKSELLTDEGELPVELQQAVLLLAGHWYNQREAVSGVQMAEVPYTIQAIVKPFRKLVD